MNSTSSLFETLKTRKILVTCGTGGVGKTTVSASLGVQAAQAGKKVVVITIDPAKRLATSLGVDSLGHHPTDLSPALSRVLRQNGEPELKGSLHAVTPKSRESFERLVRSLSDQPQMIERLIKNKLLETFSQDYSGANEYLALEELSYFYGLNTYDLVILDTPPSRNTVSFLEAPQLLSRFFEERIIRFLVLPANRLLAVGARKAFGVLESLTGSGFMNMLFEFGEALFQVQERFLAKLKNIHHLLQSDEVGFLLVAAPTPQNAREIGLFLSQIHARRFHFDGVILNRTLQHLKETPSTEPTVELFKNLKSREEAAISLLKAEAEKNRSSQDPPLFYIQLPELARDVHGLEDLYYVSKLLQN